MLVFQVTTWLKAGKAVVRGWPLSKNVRQLQGSLAYQTPQLEKNHIHFILLTVTGMIEDITNISISTKSTKSTNISTKQT